jgi:hypothetical protein
MIHWWWALIFLTIFKRLMATCIPDLTLARSLEPSSMRIMSGFMEDMADHGNRKSDAKAPGIPNKCTSVTW